MANNIIANRLNPVFYSARQPGRLAGVRQPEEIDLSNVFTIANTSVIYLPSETGGFASYTPGSMFSSLKVLQPGTGYLIGAKESFEFSLGLPSNNAALDSKILTFINEDVMDLYTGKESIEVSTSRTLTETDKGKVLKCVNTDPLTLTIPVDTGVDGDFEIDNEITFFQFNVGSVTLAAASGVNIIKHSTDGFMLEGRYSIAQIKKLSANTWFLVGRLVEVGS